MFCSVRSTNVYEEQSLGVFDLQEHDDDDAESNVLDPGRTTTWSRYLTMHARQQLAFGKPPALRDLKGLVISKLDRYVVASAIPVYNLYHRGMLAEPMAIPSAFNY